jgi:hypothetical protein
MAKQSKKRKLIEAQPAWVKTVEAIRTGTEEGKTISVEHLPDCKHKEMLMQFCYPESKICAVAVRRGITEKWVAYIGFPQIQDTKLTIDNLVSNEYWNCQHIHDIEQVKMLGDILDKETAAQLFPDWDIDQYTMDASSPTLL